MIWLNQILNRLYCRRLGKSALQRSNARLVRLLSSFASRNWSIDVARRRNCAWWWAWVCSTWHRIWSFRVSVYQSLRSNAQGSVAVGMLVGTLIISWQVVNGRASVSQFVTFVAYLQQVSYLARPKVQRLHDYSIAIRKYRSVSFCFESWTEDFEWTMTGPVRAPTPIALATLLILSSVWTLSAHCIVLSSMFAVPV